MGTVQSENNLISAHILEGGDGNQRFLRRPKACVTPPSRELEAGGVLL